MRGEQRRKLRICSVCTWFVTVTLNSEGEPRTICSFFKWRNLFSSNLPPFKLTSDFDSNLQQRETQTVTVCPGPVFSFHSVSPPSTPCMSLCTVGGRQRKPHGLVCEETRGREREILTVAPKAAKRALHFRGVSLREGYLRRPTLTLKSEI